MTRSRALFTADIQKRVKFEEKSYRTYNFFKLLKRLQEIHGKDPPAIVHYAGGSLTQ